MTLRARIVNYFGYGYGTSSRDANMTAMTANEITVTCTFENGQQFASFQELRDRIAEFEQQSYVQLYIRRSRTIKAAMKRAPKKSFLHARTEIFAGGLCMYSWWIEICFPFKREKNEPYVRLVHCAKTYFHVHLRPYIIFRTFQMECPFIIRLKTTDNGQKLFVKSMNSEHDHEINKVRHYCNSLCR